MRGVSIVVALSVCGAARAQSHEMPDGHHAMRGPLGIERARDGSGTSWLPDASPMFAVMARAGGWHFMLHDNLFVGWDAFSGERGVARMVGIGWVMGMATHELGPGELTLRAMLSPEPATVGEGGYPLVLQTGESKDGEPLHDRQHPHDLFMELALSWTAALGEDVGVQLYVAPSGEPALGPTAFPHRPSAMSDPLAPIGHHWQDATHITFGVLTAGVFTRHLKLEGSWFNGREPDEARWDLDLRAPDSWSARLSWNPSRAWSAQVSYGHLDSPDALAPEVSLQRATTSLAYGRRCGRDGSLAAMLIVGVDAPSEGPATPSILGEVSWDADAHHTLFGRAEVVRKSGHDLDVPSDDDVFDVAMLSLGYVLRVPFGQWSAGLGVRGAIGLVPAALDDAYGTTVPLGGMVYVQLRPRPAP